MSKIYTAIRDFQNEVVFVKAKSEANYGKYTDLKTLMLETRPYLEKFNLIVNQHLTHIEGIAAITTTILHEDESIESTTPLIHKPEDPQKWGAAITYARRYAYTTALGLLTDPDDDGELASSKRDNEAIKNAIKKLNNSENIEELKERFLSLGELIKEPRVLNAKDKKKEELDASSKSSTKQ